MLLQEIFENSLELPLGHARSHKKFGPDLTIVGYTRTNKQTNILNIFIYLILHIWPVCL